ncbi:hypothetical protein J6590_049734 [Homalodisca vitripennis]|nr:hypothetical protein J6590_049734 [Homalodisca vitripennis]
MRGFASTRTAFKCCHLWEISSLALPPLYYQVTKFCELYYQVPRQCDLANRPCFRSCYSQFRHQYHFLVPINNEKKQEYSTLEPATMMDA